jgi:trans-aconitate methyltransferase
MNHRPHDHDHQHHQRSGSHDQRRFLDLDAEVFGDHLAAVLDAAAVPAARSVVDLGAGTGAGSRLLRERYPDATLTCVDNDPQMLEQLRQQGFAVVEADLDNGFPALAGSAVTAQAMPEPPVDLVWASSSLHHVAHPARLLSGVRAALAPAGVLVVVELATLPSFLRQPSAVLLEQRCHAAAAAEGFNHHPDWAPVIQAAGFAVTRSEMTTVVPVTPAAREYARQWFARFAHLAQRISDDADLEPRATRTVWVASPDQNREQG